MLIFQGACNQGIIFGNGRCRKKTSMHTEGVITDPTWSLNTETAVPEWVCVKLDKGLRPNEPHDCCKLFGIPYHPNLCGILTGLTNGGPHPMIFRPALWQIHFNLFQLPENPPKKSLTQNTFKGIFQQTKKSPNIFAKSTSCHSARPACLTNVCSRAKPTAAPSPTAGCAWRTLRPPSPPGTAPRPPSWWISAMAGGSGYGRDVGRWRCGKIFELFENYAINVEKCEYLH